ncbi:CehA/McbA family metallohydrolase [Haloimpatiens sp. FM7330]|uniref:CehA/McbA family metallohydrolase n=1 Tax=Haloimpatiens sp. FM7330 TaxID=3298610 RepID=UPI00362F4AFD
MVNDIEIYDVEPADMETVHDKKPKIQACFKTYSLRVDLFSARMFLDGKPVHCKIKKDSIKHVPKKKLKKGKHSVKVFVYDEQKNKKELSWNFIIEGKKKVEIDKYNYYFGIPHAHTSYSSGKGTPKQAIEYAKNNGLDFIMITDHCKALGVGKSTSKWQTTSNVIKKMNKRHKKFLAILGFELSVNHVGHLNVINSKKLIDRNLSNIDKLHRYVKNDDDVVISINHPGKNIKNLNCHGELDEFINLIEVGNGILPHKYKRYEEKYYKLLDEGWHLGAINGQDNHKQNWGDSDNLTVVIAQKLSNKNIIDGLKKRRTYSTESRTLKLMVKANEYWMGSVISHQRTNTLKFKIKVVDRKVPIKRIEIISNGSKVIKQKEINNRREVMWNTSIERLKENTWYVVKIIQDNNKIAISSPIFCE